MSGHRDLVSWHPFFFSMFTSLTPIVWAVVAFPIVLFLGRWIQRHLQGTAFLLTKKQNASLAIYAIIMFPGVLLHELSHWVMAKLLGVQTGKFSLWPKVMKDGRLRLGYVEYYKTKGVGPMRESLIGVAPLVFGIAAVVLIGIYIFGGSDLVLIMNADEPDRISAVLNYIFAVPDVWLWLYLLFAISNAMMPSPSDREAWPLFITIMLVIVVLLYFLGFQELLWLGLVGPIATVFSYITVAFGITITVDLIFMILIGGIEWLIGRVRGVYIDYSLI